MMTEQEARDRADVGSFEFTRAWAMPSRDTFSVAPIGAFVRRYLEDSEYSIDPFARNNQWATHTNDIDQATSADWHMDAEEFCREMARLRQSFDLAIFDPPYSPRQISECYRGMGRPVSAEDTQNAALYRRVRDALLPLLEPNAIVLSFGWNSNGMGRPRGFKLIELMLVAHGAAHNDTICIAEQRRTHEVSLTFHANRYASVDTHPKDGDALAAPLVSGAVAEGQTPNPSHRSTGE